MWISKDTLTHSAVLYMKTIYAIKKLMGHYGMCCPISIQFSLIIYGTCLQMCSGMCHKKKKKKKKSYIWV